MPVPKYQPNQNHPNSDTCPCYECGQLFYQAVLRALDKVQPKSKKKVRK